MAFENLTEREKQILGNLINYYISTADPVGSRVIANKFKMGISSATIRNTLQDLEELGLVNQPHISAGRIPTDLGYRVYVDYLLKPEQLTDNEKQYIRNTILKEGRGINEILGQTCKLISDITNQLGVTTGPRFEGGILKGIHFIPVASGRIMTVVVLESGLAKSVILEIEVSVKDNDLRELEVVLNERLAGLSLGEIRKSVSQRLADVSGHGRLIKLVIDSKDKIWTESSVSEIHFSGADHLVQKPEFSDLQRVTEILKLVENGSILSTLLQDAIKDDILITIGSENKIKEIMNCSMVTSKYRVGNVTGTIAVVGPTRMEYNKLVSVVDYTARTITDVLSGIEKI